MTERVLRLVGNRRLRDEDVPAHERDEIERNGREAGELAAEKGWRELRRELDRSRRFGHDFSLLRMPRVVPDGNGGTDLARSLPVRLRSIDTVWGDRRYAFVLLPEADRDVALALVARLRRETPGLIPRDVRLAAFPEDGVTGGALIELLDERAPLADQLDVALQQGLAGA